MPPVITDPPGASLSAPRKVWRAGTLTYTAGGLVALFALLLLGDFSWSMRDRSVGPMAMWYLNHLGVPNLLFGLLISSFPALIGLVLGPVISVRSDRHRSKWGRRIPFLLVTTPMAAFGMMGIAVTPFIARWVHGHFPEESEMVVSVICFGLFWAAFEIATVASYSVFGGLVNDVVPQELLGRFYGLFRAVSLIDGVVFNYWIMGHVPTHFTIILLSVGIFYGASFFWVCLRVREGEYPPPPPAESGHRWPAGLWQEVRSYCRECFSKPYYIAVFLMLMGAGQAFMPVNTFSIPYAASLGVNMDSYGRALALTFFISLVLAYPLGWLADAFHPLRVALGALAGYLVVAVAGAVFATTPSAFLTIFVLHGVLSGAYFTASASLGARLFPRVKFAQFASAALAIGSLATMTLTPFMGIVIDQAGNVYQLTYVLGAVTAFLALLIGGYVYLRFMQLGGPQGYKPPEDEPRERL